MQKIEDLKILRIGRMTDYLVKKCTDCKVPFDATTLYHLSVLRRGIATLCEKLVLDTIQEGRIVDYVVYQLYRYREQIAQYPSGNFRITWLWSQNAVEKYYKQFYGPEAKTGINYYIDQWLGEGGLTRDYLVSVLEAGKKHPLSKYLFMESEEITKKRFLNTDVGKLSCYTSTTGWSPHSPTCQLCKFTEQCIEHFTKSLPEIIRLRKESV